MKKKFEFSDSDKALIKEAVQSLEKESSGEMVIYFARKSDSYFEACWKMAALFGVFGLVLLATMSYLWLLPATLTLLSASFYLIGLMTLGFATPYILPHFRLSMIADSTIQHRVLTKARDMFLQEEVFNTIDRTGVLIYVSEMEHQVQVLGDAGINKKIEQGDWNEVLDMVVQGIKTNHTAQGIADAVLKCKSLLLEHGFIVREDDTNELSDDIRIED